MQSGFQPGGSEIGVLILPKSRSLVKRETLVSRNGGALPEDNPSIAGGNTCEGICTRNTRCRCREFYCLERGEFLSPTAYRQPSRTG